MLGSLFRKARPALDLDWIQLEVSTQCNSSCVYCPRHVHSDRWRDGLLEWQTFERLAPAFPDTNLVYLQGWGEPLLHPEFWRMVRRTRASGAAAGFTTNGTLLDGVARENSIVYGVNIVSVSLAGATAETHGRFRQGCKLDAIEEGVAALRDLKRAKCSGVPHIHLSFVLLRSNLEEAPGLVGLAQRWGARQIVISNLNPMEAPDMQEESLGSHPDLWPLAEETLERTKRQAAEHGIRLHYQGFRSGEPGPVCPENVLKACFVSHRGDVSPCVFTNVSYEAGAGGRAGAGRLVFGNVREQTLPEIWASEKAREFRAVFVERLKSGRTGATGLPAPCRNCSRLREH